MAHRRTDIDQIAMQLTADTRDADFLAEMAKDAEDFLRIRLNHARIIHTLREQHGASLHVANSAVSFVIRQRRNEIKRIGGQRYDDYRRACLARVDRALSE